MNSTAIRKDSARFSKRFRLTTFAKYFLSYVLVLLLLFSGSLLISRSQINQIFTKTVYTAVKEKTTIINETFYNLISTMSATNEQLVCATQYEISEATSPAWRNHRIFTLIEDYEATNHMLDAIIYYHEDEARTLTTKYEVQVVDGGLLIRQYEQEFFLPLTSSVRDASTDEFYLLADGENRMMVFATTTHGFPYQFFFVFDFNAIQALFHSAMDDSLDAYALTDNRTGIFLSTDQELFSSLLQEYEPQDELTKELNGYTLYSQACVNKHFTLTAVMSQAGIASQVKEVFITHFLLMLALGGTCLVLVFIAMRLTYWPLKRLLFQLNPTAQLDKNYVAQLKETFRQAQQQSTALTAKYDSYRINIQKTLLAPVLTQHIGTDMQFSYPDIDLLFTQPVGSRFYLLYILHSAPQVNSSEPYAIQSFIEEQLRGRAIPILLASSADTSIFILCLSEATAVSDPTLEKLLADMNKELNVRIAVSDGSLSPLDVPLLYDHMMTAAKKLDQLPVAAYTPPPPQEAIPSANYPSELFRLLAEELEAQRYASASEILDNILKMLRDLKTASQDYFIHFVLLDILSSIVNCMVAHQISSDAYYTAYAEALFLCRTCDFEKEWKQVSRTLHELLNCCENSIREKGISKAKLYEAMQQHYASPDFSITALAEIFQNNPSYMSVLFVKLCGMTFTDYLWKIRLEKFEELSLTTDMTVENVSQAIGYEHVGSFRRKFKAETGMSPSEYRSQLRKQSNMV